MNKLFYVPIPLTDESPYSLIRRAMLAHGFHSVHEFSSVCLRQSALDHLAITQTAPITRFLAAEADTFATTLLDSFYQIVKRAHARHLVVSGVEVPIRYLRLTSFAFCDECFKEGWQRQIQDFTLAEFCPYHQKKYLMRCPACGGAIKWWHVLSGRCHYCDHMLTCRSASSRECRPEEYLVQSLRTQNQAYFDKIFQILRQLGSPTAKAPVAPEATRCQINEAAMLIANSDVQGLLQHLSSLHNTYPEIDKLWIAARFSGIHTPAKTEAINMFLEQDTATREKTHNTTPFLLTFKQIKRKLQKEGVYFPNPRQLRLSLNPTKRLFSIDDICAAYAAHEQYQDMGAGRLPKPKAELCTAKEAACRLYIKPQVIQTYARHGLISYYSGGHNKKFFLTDDIDGLISRLQPPRYIAGTCDIKLRTLHRAIIELNLEPTYSYGLHWSNCLFTMDDIQSIKTLLNDNTEHTRQSFRLILPELPADPIFFKNYSTYTGAVKLLKIQSTTLHQLIKWHYLHNCLISKNKIYIPNTELLKFRNKYINSKTVGKELKIPTFMLFDVLQALGIQPIVFPETGLIRADLLYKKSEISKIQSTLSMESPNEPQNYLTIDSARKRFGVNEDTIVFLAHHNFISHLQGRRKIYFRPGTVDLFFKKFSVLEQLLAFLGFPSRPTSKLIDTLYKYASREISVKSNTAEFYRFSQYILSFLDAETPVDSPLLSIIKEAASQSSSIVRHISPNCILLSQALKQYQMTNNDFIGTFVIKGFVSTTKFNGEKYLTKEAFEKIQCILQTYITCAMADRLYFYKTDTSRCLIARGVLKVEVNVSGLIAKPLLRLDKVLNYLSHNPVSSYLKIAQP
ncbi:MULTISPECIES: TniQ family protein [unclassified Pseudomonas]|uniref:TniQ family protein n=1 Tax=unclassified Pseudomonas TaxID=196821 RepID=UPI0004832056|nr:MULTISPECIES: TniQ family protein [unclassified Pseudomonas]PXX61829.1 TniQ protein [Pseudomonas sp. LAIL14HWK12:I1]SOC99135.1 TniQ protein [Pseudomonas sp. LAIL14HWK12:I3]